MTIESFKHKGLRRLFENNDRSGINPQHAVKISNVLSVLDSIENLDEIRIAAYRLHPLTGDRKGTYSITVRANWRITFRFLNGNVHDVNLEDYH